jgi:hypothetical protein
MAAETPGLGRLELEEEAVKSNNHSIVFGESLFDSNEQPGEIIESVIAGKLSARKVATYEGDVRYFGVDVEQSPVFRRLQSFGHRCFEQRTGHAPSFSFIMVNLIDAVKSPTGSGGGWHRDSLQSQYKAFAYLTDVFDVAQGAFCYLPASNNSVIRGASAIHRILSGGHRYTETTISRLVQLGLAREIVLQKAGMPFFLDTSLIHRGLPITEGRRLMATLYMYDHAPKEFASYG